MTDSEDIEIKTTKFSIGMICFIVGLILASLILNTYHSRREYRTPNELANYVEDMLFNYEHLEDLQHSKLKALITNEQTTIGDFKHWYKMYNTSGLTHAMLENQMNTICYKKEFK